MVKLRKIANWLKYPLIYASSFSALTGVAEGIKTASSGLENSLDIGVETTLNNFPFFGVVNLVYAQGVDLITKKLGRVGANIFCLGVNAAFYGYATLTGDVDPAYQVLATTAVGLTLTNSQVSSIQKQNKVSPLI